MPVISIVNAKGGVGKTTTAVNTTAALSRLNTRCLLIDMDTQGDASLNLGANNAEYSIGDVLLGKVGAKEAVFQTNGFDIIPATLGSQGLENALTPLTSPERRLKKAIKSIVRNYDFILIDCPPAIGKLTGNAITASDHYIIPMNPAPFDYHGIVQLNNFIKELKDNEDHDLKFLGYLLTVHNPRKPNSTKNTLGKAIMDTNIAFKTIIREDKMLYDCILKRMNVFQYIETFKEPLMSRGAIDYLNLAKEIIVKTGFGYEQK